MKNADRIPRSNINAEVTQYTVSIPFACMDCGNEFFNVYKLEYLKSED